MLASVNVASFKKIHSWFLITWNHFKCVQDLRNVFSALTYLQASNEFCRHDKNVSTLEKNDSVKNIVQVLIMQIKTKKYETIALVGTTHIIGTQ